MILRCHYFPKLERYQWDFESYANEADELTLKVVCGGEFQRELDIPHGESPPDLPPWMNAKKMSPEGLAQRIKWQPELADYFVKEFNLSWDGRQFAGFRTANLFPNLRAVGVMRILHYHRWKAFLNETDNVPPVFLALNPHKERLRALQFFQKVYGSDKHPISWPTAASMAKKRSSPGLNLSLFSRCFPVGKLG